MSERPGQPEQPTPYNLPDHPEWKDALLAEAKTATEARQIEETFDPSNPIDEINELELSPTEHQEAFELYYPAFGKVVDRFSQPAQARAADEEPSPERLTEKPGFLDHWKQQEQSELAKDYPNRELVMQYRRNDRMLQMAHERVFGGKNNVAAEEAIDWYLRLGALNTMEGAKPYVLIAAEKALQSNPEGSRHEHNRMVAASMLFEASVLDETEKGTLLSGEQEDLEAKAASIFKSVSGAEAANYAVSGDPRQLTNQLGAEVYLHDLHMRHLSRLSASGRLRPNDLEDEKQRLHEDLEHLVKVLTLAKMRHGATDDIRGLRSEVVTHLLIDDAIIAQNMWRVVESRKGFRREDSPRDGLALKSLPRRRFDMVLSLVGYNDDEKRVCEDFGIQIKTSSGEPTGDRTPTLRLEVLEHGFGERVLRAFRERDEQQVEALRRRLLGSPVFASGAGEKIKELLAR
jgi:hypothetical protein